MNGKSLRRRVKRAANNLGRVFLKRYHAKKGLVRVSLRYMLPECQVRRVEEHPEEKHAVVQKQADIWKKKAAGINAIIDGIFQSLPELAHDGDELRLDMLFCYFAYGFTPNEYLCYEFRNKSADERKAFISDRESLTYANRMNDYYARLVFVDKMKTYERFRPYYKREAICVDGAADRRQYMEFVRTHPVFVKKDARESCGRGVELIDLTAGQRSAEEVFSGLLDGNRYILEECVIQSREMAAINASSVNTVRCLTVNTHHGVLTPWCFLKAGRYGSFIDNGAAGGILVGIDVTSGKLCTTGIDELGRRYEAHPDSGLALLGYQLPDWDSMLSMCREMAATQPKVQWIGWDLAHTETGWIVIEGNAMSEVIGPQSTMQKGIRNELDGYLHDMDQFL